MSLRRRHLLPFLPALLVACGGGGCDRPPPAATSPEPPRKLEAPSLTLMLLTDPRGYLEPCGCQQRPLGGVDKLATAVAEARKEGRPVLLLAAGNLYFGAELHGDDLDGARTQELWKAETLAGIWKALGMTAVAPGPLDFSLGMETAAELRELGGFPWLSANLQGVEPPLTRTSLVEADGHRVGLIASHAESTVPPWPRPPAPAEADGLTAAVEDLRSRGAELVVGLHFGNRRSARELSRAGADLVVLGGLDEQDPVPPSRQGDGHMLHAGRQGQGVLRVDVSLRGEGPLSDASAWSVEAEKAQLRGEAKALAEKIEAWEQDPAVNPDDLKTQQARLAQMRARAGALRRPTPEGRWFAASLVELDPEVPGDAQIGARMDAHDARVNTHNRKALADRKPEPAAQGAPHYLGSASCAGCHAEAHTWWKGTAHGRAYATLEEQHKEFNLSCVGCHVTGYNEPGGSTVTHVENLKDVGCESCHGPGSQHVAKPADGTLIQGDAPEKVCLECHTPDHSARFDYDAFKPLLVAPGHGLPAEEAAAEETGK